jgi:transcriptional regulator with XRE-family HTH domain
MAAPTGRRDTPLPTSGPAVPLAGRLRELRERSGFTYKELSARANYTSPALSKAANGKDLQSLDVVRAYALACGADQTEVAEVEALYAKAKAEQIQLRKARRRASGQDAAPDPRLGSRVVQRVFENVVLQDENKKKRAPSEKEYSTADPAEILDYEQFGIALEQIRTEAKLTVRELIEESVKNAPEGLGLKKTTVYAVLGNKIVPSEQFVEAYLTACGMPRDRVQAWRNRLRDLNEETRRTEAARIALRELTRNSGSFDFSTDWRTVSHLLRIGAEAEQPGQAPWKPPAQYGPARAVEFTQDGKQQDGTEADRQDGAESGEEAVTVAAEDAGSPPVDDPERTNRLAELSARVDASAARIDASLGRGTFRVVWPRNPWPVELWVTILSTLVAIAGVLIAGYVAFR